MTTFLSIQRTVLGHCSGEANFTRAEGNKILVTLKSVLRSDLKFDELSVVELILVVEEACKLDVPDEAMNELGENVEATVADAVRIMAEVAGVVPDPVTCQSCELTVTPKKLTSAGIVNLHKMWETGKCSLCREGQPSGGSP